MSEFYGWLQGARGEATRCGTSRSGITAKIQSWRYHLQAEMNLQDRQGKEEEERDILRLVIRDKKEDKEYKNLKVFFHGLSLDGADIKFIEQNGDKVSQMIKFMRETERL